MKIGNKDRNRECVMEKMIGEDIEKVKEIIWEKKEVMNI